MITITDAQRNSLQITKKGIVLVRFFYGDETADTDYIALSSQELPPDWADNEYRPLLIASSRVGSGVDMFTHKFKASELRLEISNGDYHPGVKFSDLITDSSLGAGNDWGFENRLCEIRLQTQGVTSWNNCIQTFKGKVRDIIHNANIITFSIQDDREIIHSEIGTILQNSDAADTDQGLPTESNGKIRPEIWGNHIFQMSDNAKTNDTALSVGALVPALYLGSDSTGVHKWFIADAQMDQINTEGDDSEQQQIWGRDSILNRFVRLAATFTLVQNTSAGCIISHASSPTFFDYWFSKGTVAGSVSGSGTTSNPTNVNDKDYTSFGNLNGNLAATTGSEQRFDVPYPDYDDQNLADADISEIKILLYGKLTYNGVAGDGDIEVEVGLGEAPFGELVSLDTQYPTGAGFPAARLASTLATSTLADISQDQRIVQEKQNNNANTGSDFDVYEMYKQIKFTRGEKLTLYFAGKGREYSFTRGGHAEASTGVLIENPTGSIEDIYLNELGRVAADIDTSNFDIASNTLSAWKFAFHLDKLTDSLKLIQEMAQSCRSFVWLLPSGIINIKVLNDTYSASDRKIDFDTAVNPKFIRTKPQNLYTAVNVLYGDDGRGASNVDTGISEDTTMQTKYNITEAQSTLNFRTKYIVDSTTADNLRSYLLAQWKQPHNLFEGSFGLDQIDLDIGDVIEFTNMPYKVFGEDITGNVTRTGQTIYKYWWIYDVKRSSTGIKLKAFQLHKLS